MPTKRWLYLGDDPTGLALEIGGIALGRNLLVVHAQPIYQRGRLVEIYEFGRELQRWVT